MYPLSEFVEAPYEHFLLEADFAGLEDTDVLLLPSRILLGAVSRWFWIVCLDFLLGQIRNMFYGSGFDTLG